MATTAGSCVFGGEKELCIAERQFSRRQTSKEKAPLGEHLGRLVQCAARARNLPAVCCCGERGGWREVEFPLYFPVLLFWT